MADGTAKKIDQITGEEIALEKGLAQPGLESISASTEAQFESTLAEALSAVTETTQTVKSEAQDYVQYAQAQDIFPEEFNEINKLNLEFGTTIDSWSQNFNQTIDEVTNDSNLTPSIVQGVAPSLADPTLGAPERMFPQVPREEHDEVSAEAQVSASIAENVPVEPLAPYELAPTTPKPETRSVETVPDPSLSPPGFDDIEALAGPLERTDKNKVETQTGSAARVLNALVPKFMTRVLDKIKVAQLDKKADLLSFSLLKLEVDNKGDSPEAKNMRDNLAVYGEKRDKAAERLSNYFTKSIDQRIEKAERIAKKIEPIAEEIQKIQGKIIKFREQYNFWLGQDEGRHKQGLELITKEITALEGEISVRQQKINEILAKIMPYAKQMQELDMQRQKYEVKKEGAEQPLPAASYKEYATQWNTYAAQNKLKIFPVLGALDPQLLNDVYRDKGIDAASASEDALSQEIFDAYVVKDMARNGVDVSSPEISSQVKDSMKGFKENRIKNNFGKSRPFGIFSQLYEYFAKKTEGSTK
ncbi:MAG: hypothetical protein M3Q73_00910 [bacterium]|nr:hypothetical protein [bacterium]